MQYARSSDAVLSLRRFVEATRHGERAALGVSRPRHDVLVEDRKISAEM